MKISILGCGWLGTPLAVSLIEDGHALKGSTTTDSKLQILRNRKIDPYLLRLEPELHTNNGKNFWNSDLLVLNIPPNRGREDVVEYHTAQIEAVTAELRTSPVQCVIFISSTSVYPDHGGVMTENDTATAKASRPSGEALRIAENMLLNENSFKTTVIRFGGLYGYDRHPVKYLAGKRGLSRAKAPVNLIHRDDCIQIIKLIIEKDITGEIFNAVSDGHPPRKQYYTEAARQHELDPPGFAENGTTEKEYKVVSNRKLKNRLNYRFQFPNPMDFRSP